MYVFPKIEILVVNGNFTPYLNIQDISLYFSLFLCVHPLDRLPSPPSLLYSSISFYSKYIFSKPFFGFNAKLHQFIENMGMEYWDFKCS